MATKNQVEFYASDTAAELLAVLKAMEKDPSYDTSSSYTADGTSYPDHRMPFRDKHMMYISQHPQVDLSHYISNLRIITRKR